MTLEQAINAGIILDLRDPAEEAEYAKLHGMMAKLKQPGLAGAYLTAVMHMPPPSLARLPRMAFIEEANRHEVVMVPVLDPEGNPRRTVHGKPLMQPDILPDGTVRRRLINRFEEMGGELVGGRIQRAHSWVRNGYNLAVNQMLGYATGATYGAGGLQNKQTSGTARSAPHWIAGVQYWVGPLGSLSYGIAVGTGTSAESFEDFALGTLVANGTGAGQLSYAAQETTTGAYTAGTLTWASTFIRYINNNSGGAIVVGEVGVYAYVTSSAIQYTEMLARDLVSPTVSVANTAQLKVTYTITSVAYPS